MKNILNANRIPTTDFLSQYSAGKFRFISKCRAGFLTISDAVSTDNLRYLAHPESLLTAFKKGALQTIQFNPEGTDIWLTVFARVGKKIHLIDQTILANLTVGTINQYWYNTNLYSQVQYSVVGAKTWADKAYVLNGDTSTLAGIEFPMPTF